MSHIFLEYAVHRRSGKKYHVRAEVVAACSAEFAFAAGFSGLKSNAVACFQMSNVFSDFDNGSTGFMAKYEGRFHNVIANTALLIVMKV